MANLREHSTSVAAPPSLSCEVVIATNRETANRKDELLSYIAIRLEIIAII
jgi:hypothetical protein